MRTAYKIENVIQQLRLLTPFHFVDFGTRHEFDLWTWSSQWNEKQSWQELWLFVIICCQLYAFTCFVTENFINKIRVYHSVGHSVWSQRRWLASESIKSIGKWSRVFKSAFVVGRSLHRFELIASEKMSLIIYTSCKCQDNVESF